MRTVSGSRHEFVDRENRIILESRDRGKTTENCGDFTSPPFYCTAWVIAEFMDASGNPLRGATATWRVVKAQNKSLAMTTGWENKMTGLTWGSTPESGNGGYSNEAQRLRNKEITDSATSTTNSLGQAAIQLTDIVGERVITVEANVTIGGREYTVTQDVSFGRGPLSVFKKTGTTGSRWGGQHITDNSGSPASGSFQYSGNSFPAANFCGGSVDNKVTTTGNSTDAGFIPASPGGWSDPYIPPGRSDYYRYAQNSKLAKAEQLLAVAVYNSTYNTQGKGAAFAAGWWLSGHPSFLNYAWSGEVGFDKDSDSEHGGAFSAMYVRLDEGLVGRYYVEDSSRGVPVCLLP
jgi:hypothetical protein